MIDKTEIECRFRRSVDSYEDNATVQKWIVQRLVELLPDLGNRVWHRTLIRKNQPALGGSAILGE